MRSLALGLGVLLASSLFLSPSMAATVRATTGGSGPYGISQGGVFYDAAAGEANRLRVSLVPGSRGLVDVHDDGASISARDRCIAISSHEARCDTAADFVDVMVDAKDLDDEVTVATPLYAIVVGGDGNDTLIGGCQLVGDRGDDVLAGCSGISPALNHTLRGGPGDDVINGGDSPDIIDGGGGHDILRGGDGNDAFDDGDAAARAIDADVVEGGPGQDSVNYAERRGPVRVDLADPSAPQGAAGEGDELTMIENVASGPANDTLRGDAGPNRLDAGAGADTVEGRDGDDVLFGGAGVDTVDAGPGNDEVVTRDLYADTVRCSSGADRALVDRGDRLADCEDVARTPVDLIPGRYRLGVRNGSVTIPLSCYELDELPQTVAREFDRCSFAIVLKLPVSGRLVVAGRTSCANMACKPLRLSRGGWRMLKRRRQVTGVVQFVRTPRTGALLHSERAIVKVSRR